MRVAMRPSSERASLSETCGRPVVMNFVHGAMSARASSPATPTRPRRPRRASRCAPPPSTCGLGSRQPMTTRAMPASRIASTHGGVRPLVVARLERHVERAAPRLRRRRGASASDLGVVLAGALVVGRRRRSRRPARRRPRRRAGWAKACACRASSSARAHQRRVASSCCSALSRRPSEWSVSAESRGRHES